jgi:hypothetical protein
MRLRRPIALLIVIACAALLTPASALAAHSVGTREQIAWVRRAATNFVDDELTGNGTGACGILNAPLRATQHGRTCAQRLDGRIATITKEPGGRATLRAQRRAIASAVVVVHGNTASLAVPTPLLNGSNHFLWTENCWMLMG